MTTKSLLLAAALTLFASACESSAAEVCDHDGCIVSLAELNGACAKTLQSATTECPGVTVDTGPCGDLTHVKVTTANPTQDCYYATASGELVAGISRSDSGFTKIAGTIPAQECPATTRVCDHTPLAP